MTTGRINQVTTFHDCIIVTTIQLHNSRNRQGRFLVCRSSSAVYLKLDATLKDVQHHGLLVFTRLTNQAALFPDLTSFRHLPFVEDNKDGCLLRELSTTS